MADRPGGPPGREFETEYDDAPDLLSEALLDCIAASGALSSRLASAPSDEHRRAIVDIHAYLGLLSELTELPLTDVKRRLGCRRDVSSLPDWPLDELYASRDFLAFASEVCLACERPPIVVGLALDLAIITFRLSDFDSALSRQALQFSEDGESALSALANHDLVLALQLIEDFPNFYSSSPRGK